MTLTLNSSLVYFEKTAIVMEVALLYMFQIAWQLAGDLILNLMTLRVYG